MKTLANCTLREFLMQTNRIRHAAADFYKDIGIGTIRKNLPQLTGDETDEEKAEKFKAQSRKNISDIIDRCLEENVDKTIELVGMLCFKTAEEAQDMDSGEFLDVVFDVLTSERVINFFMKLTSSGLIDMVK
jgi:TusA-related sulfurtransferase